MIISFTIVTTLDLFSFQRPTKSRKPPFLVKGWSKIISSHIALTPLLPKYPIAFFTNDSPFDRISASVAPPTGPDLEVDVKDNGDGTYSVEYVPERPGRHSVDVKYGGRRVPKSPFRVQVKPSGDASKVEIDGLGPDDTFLVGKENDFTVDCTKAGKGQSFGIKLFKKHFFFTRQTLCAAQLGCEGRSFPHPRSSCFEGRLALTQGQILIQVFLFLFPKPFRVIFFIL